MPLKLFLAFIINIFPMFVSHYPTGWFAFFLVIANHVKSKAYLDLIKCSINTVMACNKGQPEVNSVVYQKLNRMLFFSPSFSIGTSNFYNNTCYFRSCARLKRRMRD